MEDITGKTFGRLTAVRLHHKKQRYNSKGQKAGFRYMWEFKCSCGNIVIAEKTDVKIGHTNSCGCYNKEVLRNTGTHHDSDSRLYNVWKGIKKRCYDEKSINYQWYGGEGIRVCDEWLAKDTGYMSFKNWAYNNGYKEIIVNNRNILTLDRINNNGDYCPENCRWITQKQQRRNTSNNINITINNETKCLQDWADEYGVNRGTANDRYHKGWKFDEILSKDMRFYHKSK